MTSRLYTIALRSLLAGAPCALAQRPDSAQCRAMLARPGRDSTTVTIGMTVRAFDSTKVISASVRANLVSAAQEVLQLPRPLPLEIYTIDGPHHSEGGTEMGLVVPTMAGNYAGELWPDGHIDKLRVIGGGRVAAFDNAFLGALRLVSDLHLLPPLPGGVKKPMDVRIAIAPLGDPAKETRPDSAGRAIYLPLLRMRVPTLGMGRPADLAPGNKGPRYPELARQAGVEGRVRLRFVVNTDGTADLGSIELRDATLRDFVSATFEAFPKFRFTPLQYEGCALPSLVELPFEFRLRR